MLGTSWLAACTSVSPGHPPPSALTGGDQPQRNQPVIAVGNHATQELDAAHAEPGEDTDVVVSNDLWDRIRAGFSMPELDSPLVARHEQYYLSRPEYLQRMFGRGSYYLHYIVEEVERRGMPTELALLPFVESAMNPAALSSAKAAGLWQFIPATGKRYDLNQNWWVDNRRDVVQSTRAALDYLQTIYHMNGDDWFLALASYNWGEGAVKRAMRNSQAAGNPADYAHLRMPVETRNYVPKLLALKHIVLNARQLGLQLPALPDHPYFVTVEKTRPIDLKLAASFAGMTETEFLALNPAHNRPVISASRNNTLKIPVDRIERFKAAMAAHAAQKKPFVTWQPHTLQPGENLLEIAQRGGLTVPALLRANGVPAGTHLLAGTRLLVPARRVSDENLVEQFNGPRLYKQVEAAPLQHRVRRGETASSVARRYGLSLAGLRALNRQHIGRLKPGMMLTVRPRQKQTVLVAEDGSHQIISHQSRPPQLQARPEPLSGGQHTAIRLVHYSPDTGSSVSHSRAFRAETAAMNRHVTLRSTRSTGITHHTLHVTTHRESNRSNPAKTPVTRPGTRQTASVAPTRLQQPGKARSQSSRTGTLHRTVNRRKTARRLRHDSGKVADAS